MAPPQGPQGFVDAADLMAASTAAGPPELFLLLSAKRRVLAVGGSLPSRWDDSGAATAGRDLDLYLPALARRLPDDLSQLPRPRTGWPAPPHELVLSAAELATTGLNGPSLLVQVMPLEGDGTSGETWLVRVRAQAVPQDRRAEHRRQLALALRASPLERIASALAHDLSNTFQALLGSLWLLEESSPGSPRTSSLLSTVVSAAQQGAALVRQQSEVFRRRSESHHSLAALFRESEAVLRRLLGAEARLHIEPTRLAERCLLDHTLARPLFLLLCHYLGTHASEPVELTIRQHPLREAAAPVDATAPADGSDSPGLRLTLRSNLPSTLLSAGTLDFPHPLWAVEVLTRELGGSFLVDCSGDALAFEILLPVSADRPESSSLTLPKPGKSDRTEARNAAPADRPAQPVPGDGGSDLT